MMKPFLPPRLFRSLSAWLPSPAAWVAGMLGTGFYLALGTKQELFPSQMLKHLGGINLACLCSLLLTLEGERRLQYQGRPILKGFLVMQACFLGLEALLFLSLFPEWLSFEKRASLGFCLFLAGGFSLGPFGAIQDFLTARRQMAEARSQALQTKDPIPLPERRCETPPLKEPPAPPL